MQLAYPVTAKRNAAQHKTPKCSPACSGGSRSCLGRDARCRRRPRAPAQRARRPAAAGRPRRRRHCHCSPPLRRPQKQQSPRRWPRAAGGGWWAGPAAGAAASGPAVGSPRRPLWRGWAGGRSTEEEEQGGRWDVSVRMNAQGGGMGAAVGGRLRTGWDAGANGAQHADSARLLNTPPSAAHLPALCGGGAPEAGSAARAAGGARPAPPAPAASGLTAPPLPAEPPV